MHTEKKEAGLSTRPSPVFEQLLLSYCSVTQPNSVALVLRDNFVQLEDRQEHRDHDSADDYPEENDQEWFNQRSQCVQHRFNFAGARTGVGLRDWERAGGGGAG